MRLAQFIQTEMEQLLQDWEEAALEIAPELKEKDSRTLRDHARSMLEFISRDLTTNQTRGESARKALGKGGIPFSVAAEGHGTDRLLLGMSMVQMIQELRALRARVTVAWGDAQQGLTTEDIGELVRFNEAIDQLVANSVASYSAGKERSTRLFDAMLKVSPDPSAIFDPDGKLLFFNTPMAELTNTTPEEATGKTPLELGLGVATELQGTVAKTVSSRHAQRREFHLSLPSGREAYFDCQFVPVFDERGDVEAVAKTSRDITERKLAEQQVWRSANYDLLTGIPNRRLFLDRLEQSLLEAERKESSIALLFIDLDLFKQANDQLGHKAGDRLLEQVANRISTHVRAMDTVARLGGDEFTLILKDTGKYDAKEAARALLVSLETPFDVDSHRVNISGSIGLTLFPEDGKTVDQMMHNADQAMYAAKSQGGQQICLYEPWMAQNESEHMRLNSELDQAFNSNQLEIFYQPIIDLRTGVIVRAEALLRWNHPEKGLLTPDAFLTIAEQSGMTDRINAFVLEQAVASSIGWCDQQGEAFPININKSPASFFTQSLVDQWRERLSRSGLSESRITIELTPNSLNKIHASGLGLVKNFSLVVDDFGIEPFSLLALQELHVDSLKVDKELIKDIGQGNDADRLMVAIIAMGHALDVRVIAAGVENEEQLQFLSNAGCDHAQGFLFSRPQRRKEFEALLKRKRQYNPYWRHSAAKEHAE